jgi:hypothetical protein
MPRWEGGVHTNQNLVWKTSRFGAQEQKRNGGWGAGCVCSGRAGGWRRKRLGDEGPDSGEERSYCESTERAIPAPVSCLQVCASVVPCALQGLKKGSNLPRVPAGQWKGAAQTGTLEG